ncbi:hydrogen dehydrogenase protein [Halorhabdus tiamatea SARL4B]|uniref:Hydrogen dehydrogenase protein n=1 Tax=Halorhabdus tiamatea SARL4B TaxID=1033806 RepID=F7PL36_9EURY|nr:Ni/Fe hydrogenase subunit alpha [Halorhabdus tiamatea]ERJ05847.1 hydrogen dehydrogenase protein [Halorhabdus tiamatea SARL4B]CCQ34473.1 Ni/Fe hydrogenase, alpha subunit [Halorhabdus tiamatea SARL4B]
MSHTIDVEGDLVTRVEGHGSIVVNVEDGELETCEWQVVESPRYFESMLVGRSFRESHHVTSRICAICSVSHTIASLQATEAAMGVSVSEQDRRLRKLALYGETLQSHVLHLGYLALPDLVGEKSVLPLAETHPDELQTVIDLHRLGNELTEVVTGRSVHAQRLLPGGFSQLPEERELEALLDRLVNSWDAVADLADLLAVLADELPDFERETEYISLTHPEEYAFAEGTIHSSDVGEIPVSDYRDVANEYVVEHSTAKFARHERDSYMVGALARFNNNADQLAPRAADIVDRFGLEPPVHNPYLNNVAQLVEVAHLLAESVRLIEAVLADGLAPQSNYHVPEIDPTAGSGIGAIEVPRGVLFHEYAYDDAGEVTEANCVIPTNQNHGNIQRDMETLVPTIIERPEDDVKHTLEMLVRAYDPCISCSTHYLDVEFVGEAA